MILAQHFIIGLLASFIGSLPIGVLNLTTIDIAVHKGLKKVAWFAFGATIIEYFQAVLGLKFSSWFLSDPVINMIFEAVAVVLFASLSIYYFKADGKKTVAGEGSLGGAGEGSPGKGTGRANPFLRAVALSLINPLAIPYWILYGTWFEALGWIGLQNNQVLIFSAGITAGTFLALLGIGYFSRLIISRMTMLSAWLNRIIAITFACLAIFQLTRVLLNLWIPG